MRVAAKIGNLPSKFQAAFGFSNCSLWSRRTDRRTDGQKQRLLPLPYGREKGSYTTAVTWGSVHCNWALWNNGGIYKMITLTENNNFGKDTEYIINSSMKKSK